MSRSVRATAAAVAALCAASALLAAAFGVAANPPAAKGAEAENTAPAIIVFAAASLAEPVGEIARAFTARAAEPGERASARVPVRTSFAASSVLAKQIEAGAPADVFLSADTEWMAYLEERHLLREGSQQNLLGNQLVLIAPAGSTVEVTLRPHANLAAALGGGRLATGDPDLVPVGRYALAALMNLGMWDQVAPRLVRAENVRMALEYVARGEATLGIVYRTDALAEKRVRLVDVFPASSHPPVIYPVALTAGAAPAAAAFEAFLESDAAREVFVRYGFERLPLRTSRSESR
ncbi:MAG TPA: molybdate ABC transporter substrate-binding protein [Steroidobacteraceae bacterium]|nr:molybdate ABC transporter substrate-binding protein [Steroidobacteraceae bacterium]